MLPFAHSRIGQPFREVADLLVAIAEKGQRKSLWLAPFGVETLGFALSRLTFWRGLAPGVAVLFGLLGKHDRESLRVCEEADALHEIASHLDGDNA